MQAGAGWFMDYHNADGSFAEMCGNGARLFARFWSTPGHGSRGGLLARHPGWPASGSVSTEER